MRHPLAAKLTTPVVLSDERPWRRPLDEHLPVPTFSDRHRNRIGDRDGRACGICRDPARLVRDRLPVPIVILANDSDVAGVAAGDQLDSPWQDEIETVVNTT